MKDKQVQTLFQSENPMIITSSAGKTDKSDINPTSTNLSLEQSMEMHEAAIDCFSARMSMIQSDARGMESHRSTVNETIQKINSNGKQSRNSNGKQSQNMQLEQFDCQLSNNAKHQPLRLKIAEEMDVSQITKNSQADTNFIDQELQNEINHINLTEVN